MKQYHFSVRNGWSVEAEIHGTHMEIKDGLICIYMGDELVYVTPSNRTVGRREILVDEKQAA